jgi:hypothetical protein
MHCTVDVGDVNLETLPTLPSFVVANEPVLLSRERERVPDSIRREKEWRIHHQRPPRPDIISSSSSSVHGRVRVAVCARTASTVAGSTGSPACPHSRRT